MARRSTLRASDADRETIADRLRRAAHEGRITTEELEHRLAAAFKARTYGDLDQIVADLPRTQQVSRRRRRTNAATARKLAVSHPFAAIVVGVAVVTAAAIALAIMAVIATAWAGWIVFAWIFFGSRRCGLRWSRRHQAPVRGYVRMAPSRSRGYWA